MANGKTHVMSRASAPPPPQPFWLKPLCSGCAVAMDGERVGAAARRRGHPLRAWHRHVRTTVAMELATALHHSVHRVEVPREGVEHEKHVGLRAQKPPLEEVSQPQAGIRRHTGVGYELVLNPVVPQMAEQLVEVFSLPVEFISPAPGQRQWWSLSHTFQLLLLFQWWRKLCPRQRVTSTGALGGAFLTQTSRVSSAGACIGVYCTRASGVPIASDGAFLTNTSRVSSASAWSLLHPRQQCPNRQ